MALNRNLPEELKESYEFTCVTCGYEQMAAPSIVMELGINSGHGSCLNCNTFLHLEIAPNGEFMISQAWDEYSVDQELGLLEMNDETK